MWQAPLFAALADRSRPGASFSTFTAAACVRHGLAQAGFVVERVAGFAGKRHRLISHNSKYIRTNRGTSVLSSSDVAHVRSGRPTA